MDMLLKACAFPHTCAKKRESEEKEEICELDESIVIL
jgi:hypothetical protein